MSSSMFLSISYNKSARLICGLLLLSCRIVDRGKKIEQNNHNSCFSCSLFGITSLKKTNFILVEMSSNVGKRQQQLSNLRFIQKAKREQKKKIQKELSQKWKLWNRVCHYMSTTRLLFSFYFNCFFSVVVVDFSFIGRIIIL